MSSQNASLETLQSPEPSNADAQILPREVPQSSPSPAESDLWVFREGQKESSGPAELRELCQRLAHLHSERELIDVLIQAGALESALADAGRAGAKSAEDLTDAIAFALCSGRRDPQFLQRLASRITTPERLRTSPPEGFTYYALHPLDFARLASRIREEPKACAVIGIRTIGTTLSAVVTAALKLQGRSVSRITVRPAGHPYSRLMAFSSKQYDWIRQQLSRAAQFLVVDEGPGRSGSTFLAVAEALVRAGVPRELITLLGSRQVDPNSLLADQAAARWNAFRFLASVPSVNQRFERCRYIGGGEWRKWRLMEGQQWSSEDWPESWTQMERLKFLSEDGRFFIKFEGMGPLGAAIRERASALSESGFSPHAKDIGDGFLAYSVVGGATLRSCDLNSLLLEQMARYCAFRTIDFGVQSDRPEELRQMVEYNVQQEFGFELSLPQEAFEAQNPVLADARMQPYEWISGERIFKTDSVDHGDNHFFPGPCDIAWDLAGAVVEWRMTREATQQFLSMFQNFSGIDASARLPIYVLAYSVFRLGFCKMAVSTSTGDDAERLQRAYMHYRHLALPLLKSYRPVVREISVA